MKLFKFFLLSIFIITLTSCGTVENAFTNNKKNNSDEFLVEKKSPLVMPPGYDELPIPKDNETKNDVDEGNIKNLIINNSNSSEINNVKNSDLTFEKNLIDKIKNN
tara:strand:+ start:53 stop:370 length:318 start_codon:yes stop_codon:yes gene_type:complete